jgi:hypothetical protein
MVDHSLGEEPVQDSLILLHLGHVLYRVGGVGLEMLELAQELLPITVQKLLFLLHLLNLSPGALLLGCAFKHMGRLSLGCYTNDALILTYMRSCCTSSEPLRTQDASQPAGSMTAQAYVCAQGPPH